MKVASIMGGGVNLFKIETVHKGLISCGMQHFYRCYLSLLSNSIFVFTVSSGIQDETTFLKILCFTCRNTTHKNESRVIGSNTSVEDVGTNIIENVFRLFDTKTRFKPSYSKEWNINAGDIISKIIKNL